MGPLFQAHAEQSAVQEVSSQELLLREGETDPIKLPPRSTHEQVFRVSVDDDTRLIVTLLHPDGPGPFPLVVMNHGASGSKMPPALQPRARFTFSAYYFLSRGYAVMLPMLRGYAGSDGTLRHFGCDLFNQGRSDAQDINTVINAMANRPEIDASRIIIAGQSFGGWNTLAFGTIDRSNVVGLVNFNGGIRTSDCSDNNRALIKGAQAFGAATHVPSIWFYGQTDTLFQPDLRNAMHDAYVEAGGHAELVDIGDFFTDSHQFLSYPEALSKWVPNLDAFLEKIGMPHSQIYAGYLPNPWPAPSGFAQLDEVDKVPYLGDEARDVYKKSIAHALPRVIAISPKGDIATQYGGYDQVSTVLKNCETKLKRPCQVYAIDNDVVWHPIPDPPPPSRYAELENADALPYLGPARVKFYADFLSRPSPRALVISPDGKAYGVYGKRAYEQAMVNCRAHSARCEPYVIDDDVVWSAPK